MSELSIVIGETVEAIYSDEAADILEGLGNVAIKRASRVEPESDGWYADMSLVDGPKLGPFLRRSDAIDSEISWLRRNKNL
jgi:hypothetical protein